MRRLTRNADTRSLFPSPFDTLILTHFPNTVNRISKKICDFFIIFCHFFGQFDQLTLTYNKARLFSQPLFDGFCRQGGNLFLKSETFTYILVQKSLFLCDFLLICKSMQKCGRNTFLPHKNVKIFHYCKAAVPDFLRLPLRVFRHKKTAATPPFYDSSEGSYFSSFSAISTISLMRSRSSVL